MFPLSHSDSHLISRALCFLLYLSFFVQSLDHLDTWTLITFDHFLVIEFVTFHSEKWGQIQLFDYTYKFCFFQKW
jgi:protoporphyrinogen oxidase